MIEPEFSSWFWFVYGEKYKYLGCIQTNDVV